MKVQPKIGSNSNFFKKGRTVGLLPVDRGANNGVEGREHEAAVVRHRGRVVYSLKDSVDKLVELDRVVQSVEPPFCCRRIFKFQIHTNILRQDLKTSQYRMSDS